MLFVVCVVVTFCLGIQCKKEPPINPPDSSKSEIVISLFDTTCTEAWIRLQTKNLAVPHDYKLYRDSDLVYAGRVYTNDTTVIDTSLLPQRNYHYMAYRIDGGVIKDSSAVLPVNSMDTTSHEFIWSVETIGYHYSIIRDVAIVNDTLAYAVGHFYASADTAIGNQVPYNVACWNGVKWELMRVMVETRQIPPNPPHYYWPDEIFGIFAFSPNEIILATQGQFIKWDGISEKGSEYVYMPNTSVQTVWGTTPKNVFGAGYSGSFVRYDGTTWTKYDSLTNTTLTDIYGTRDGKEVWATGYNFDGRSAVVRWSEGNLEKIFSEMDGSAKQSSFLSGYLPSLWIDKSKIYLSSSMGYIMTYSLITKTPKAAAVRLQYFPYAIRGSGCNNIIVACDRAVLYHFNGSTWKTINQFNNINHRLFSISFHKRLIITSGRTLTNSGQSALVIIGKKL